MRESTHPPRSSAVALLVLVVVVFVVALARAGAALAADPGGSAAPSGGGTLPTVPVPTPAPAVKAKTKSAPKAKSGPKAAARAIARPGAVPVVTEALCLGACTAGKHAVPLGGILVLHGHRLARGMAVVFPSNAVAASVHPTATIRLSREGFIVNVPVTARTGRITVVAQSGVRSKPFGPIRFYSSAPAVPGPAPNAAPAGSAFDGPGIWIWYVAKSDAGDLDAIAAQAAAAGVHTVYVKSSDGSTNFWSQFTPALVAGLHQRGLRVCAWQYVYGTHPAGEAQLGARAAAMSDCLVIDAESEYEGRYASAQTYMQTLRGAIGPSYPVGLASFPYVDRHEALPYSVFLGPGGAQFNLPQIYWHEIGVSPDVAVAHTYHENRIYARPIMPLGQTYGGTPPAEIIRFRQLSAAYGATGISWWDWQETTTGGWAALAQALAPTPAAPPISVDATLPLFSAGAKGDQIVWLQEHLAAAEPQTPTTGIFDAQTTAALIAFQAQHGLPQSGTTDPATWQALLALTPVAVDWTANAAPG